MIVVLGDYMRDEDYFYRTIRQSPEGPWPVVAHEATNWRPGGAGAVAAMAEAMGADVLRIGNQESRMSIKRRVYVDGSQVFRHDTDCDKPFTANDVSRLIERMPRGAIVLVSDYGKGSVTKELWEEVKTSAIVDPSRTRYLSWYSGCRGIVPNRQEAGVQGVVEGMRVSRELRRHAMDTCVKLDRDGMAVNGLHHLPATCSEPIDVCGAGDMVLAAIGVALANGAEWLEACRFANQMAGRKCRQHGATPVHALYPG